MPSQLDMFSRPGRPQVAKGDPDTSRKAAAALEESGLGARQRKEILSALCGYVDAHGEAPTSAELTVGDMRDTRLRYQAARRLPELATLGLAMRGAARTCQVSGRSAIVWWPTREGRKALEEGR